MQKWGSYSAYLTEYIKIEFEKESRDYKKGKETSRQLGPVRISYVIIMHEPVTVSSNVRDQMHVQIKHSLAYLQELILTLAGIKYISNNTSQSRD